MYHLQKLENISGRHLTAYVLQMQEDGKSPSTIKTDLAAIRFFHDKMSRPKYRLPSNDELVVELERRCFGGVDRTVPINEQIALALRQQGMGALDAHFTVSRLLGHERPDMTDIYLTSVRGGGGNGA